MSIILLVLFSFFSHLTILDAQLNFTVLDYVHCFNDKGEYTNTSTYRTNLNTLLSELTSNTNINYGFYNSSYGQIPNKVSAVGLCGGDIKPIECRYCLNNATILLRNSCPYQKEVIGGFGECMLRYSNRTILGVMQDDYSQCMSNPDNATEVDKFDVVVSNLLYRLKGEAANGDSLHKFAAGNETGPNFQTVFGVVQCVPDLSEQDCTNCLVGAIWEIPKCIGTKKGGRVIKPSCNVRFESDPFFDYVEDSAQASSPLSPTTLTSKGNSHKSITVTIVVALTLAFFVLLVFLCIYFGVKKPKKTLEIEEIADGEIKATKSLQFDFETIRLATDNFSDENKLGQGGFGAVYKGKLYDGQEVAVKRLATNSSQGDEEFKNEVLLLAKLHHRNLVRLLGFCLESKERLLVYELLPNKSLDYLLFDSNRSAQLEWKTRYKILQGIARGLLYLHEDSQERIIHRDLKASNILLDAEMNPKISDFGMARLFVMDQTQANTKRIVGTYGYMAPEYAKHGQFSVKSDIFSFGVLLLEIISGQRNAGIHNGDNIKHLTSFAWKSWKKGRASSIVDPALKDGSRNEIMRCIHIGLLCVQEKPSDRPTFSALVLMLDSHTFSLRVPSRPAFFMDQSSVSTISSEKPSKSVKKLSVNEVSVTDIYPR